MVRINKKEERKSRGNKGGLVVGFSGGGLYSIWLKVFVSMNLFCRPQ